MFAFGVKLYDLKIAWKNVYIFIVFRLTRAAQLDRQRAKRFSELRPDNQQEIKPHQPSRKREPGSSREPGFSVHDDLAKMRAEPRGPAPQRVREAPPIHPSGGQRMTNWPKSHIGDGDRPLGVGGFLEELELVERSGKLDLEFVPILALLAAGLDPELQFGIRKPVELAAIRGHDLHRFIAGAFDLGEGFHLRPGSGLIKALALRI